MRSRKPPLRNPREAPRPAAPAPRTRVSPTQPRPRRERPEAWLYGRHAVAAALGNPARHWRRLVVLPGQEEEAAELTAAAQAEHRGSQEPVQVLDRAALAQLLPEGAVHQGLALEIEPLEPVDLDDVLRAAALRPEGRSVIVVLDQVSDPHNVGAIMRSAAAFGALAVIVPEHGAPQLSGTLAKAASGALDRLPLVRAVNLSRVLERLKEAGYWCCGLDEAAPAPIATLDLGDKVALVLGSEGGGLRRLLREHCDYLARLPTLPALPSLNVSNAAAIALYELARGAGEA